MIAERGTKAARWFWNLTFSCHNFEGCFLFFESRKYNFATFCPSPCKNIFGPPLENPLLAPPWKKIPAPMFRGSCSSIEILKGYMPIYRNAEGVHAHLSKCWRGTCSSIEMLKGYMLIYRNAEGVHAHLSKCWRGTCLSIEMLKGCMLIYRNAEGVRAHLSKCWRGSWTERVWETLS